MTNFFTERYSRQGLWSLFLMCAFPIHAWAIILAFRDLSWLTERTNAWDAVGVFSYGMIFAFIESTLLFGVLVLLGLLIPKSWKEDRRIGLLAILFLILSLWAMISQLYFLAGMSPASWFVQLLLRNAHPLRALYVIAFLVVLPSFLIPAYLLTRAAQAPAFLRELIDRLSLLTTLYLFFDVLGLVVVLFRNIQ